MTKTLWLILLYQFCVTELQTLIARPPMGGTIAAHLWEWLKFSNKPFGYVLRRIGWLALLVVLVVASGGLF